MDKEQLVRKIMEKGKDYTQQSYLAGFFVVFILLIVFIIRPSVNDYVTRQKQFEETKQMVAEYQKVIQNLTKLQSVLETHRDDFSLLDKAVPQDVGLYQLAQDINTSLLPYAPSHSYGFPGYSISGNKKAETSSPGLEPIAYPISTDVQGSYSTLRGILTDVTSQSRIKTVTGITITRDGDATASANLLMKLDIQAYHL